MAKNAAQHISIDERQLLQVPRRLRQVTANDDVSWCTGLDGSTYCSFVSYTVPLDAAGPFATEQNLSAFFLVGAGCWGTKACTGRVAVSVAWCEDFVMPVCCCRGLARMCGCCFGPLCVRRRLRVVWRCDLAIA